VDFYHNRRTQLLRGGKADEVDAHLVLHPANVRYLTGLDVAEGVLVSAKGTFAIYPEAAVPPRKLLPAEVTAVPRADGITVEAAAAEAIRTAAAKAVGVEGERLPVAALHRLAEAVGKTPLRPLSGRVEDLRATKDPSEVEAIKKALGVGGRALLMFRAILREIDTELDLCRQMDQLLLRAGADAPAFPTQVALGDNGGAAVLRPTTDRPVSEASKVFVRWGAAAEGYCGVFARTFRSPFGAPPLRKTKLERTAHAYDKVNAAVRAAVTAAADAARPEATAGELATAAHAQLAAAGFDKYAALEVGHGVGVEPHEGPFLRPDDPTPLHLGMVLHLTPQVRIPEWGIVKHSRTVVVTRDGVSDLGGYPATDD
jgi:Xaa-Pro aminopeptidase